MPHLIDEKETRDSVGRTLTSLLRKVIARSVIDDQKTEDKTSVLAYAIYGNCMITVFEWHYEDPTELTDLKSRMLASADAMKKLDALNSDIERMMDIVVYHIEAKVKRHEASSHCRP